MKKQIRMLVICILAVAGVALLMGDPIEEEMWSKHFLASKIEGFALWGLASLLYLYWNKRGLLPEDDYKDEWV